MIQLGLNKTKFIY